ncbi:dephospho-CoA kinase [Akkermansiaceae bacterium]|nr:dephospho-CoA kinase [Akkermansiaceae bacterium]
MKRAFGLTGGIATGKSTALALLLKSVPNLVSFDADIVVRDLLQDTEVLSELTALFGNEILALDGSLNRPAMREIVFSDSVARKSLEACLHPKVRKECLEKHRQWLTNEASTLFVADVPLLFEVGLDFGQDQNLVVATTEVTQRSRLKTRNHFDDEMISSILAAQLPILEKVKRADVVFWNEGPLAVLERQITHFTDAY